MQLSNVLWFGFHEHRRWLSFCNFGIGVSATFERPVLRQHILMVVASCLCWASEAGWLKKFFFEVCWVTLKWWKLFFFYVEKDLTFSFLKVSTQGRRLVCLLNPESTSFFSFQGSSLYCYGFESKFLWLSGSASVSAIRGVNVSVFHSQ